MNPADYIAVGVGVAILGFLWNLHRDIVGLRDGMADLRERMARLEGLVEGFTRRGGLANDQ